MTKRERHYFAQKMWFKKLIRNIPKGEWIKKECPIMLTGAQYFALCMAKLNK